MRLGWHALGIGLGARPEIIRAVAVGAERHGFATLWPGEHVVMLDAQTSRHPYSADGRIAVPADADCFDPLLAPTYASASERPPAGRAHDRGRAVRPDPAHLPALAEAGVTQYVVVAVPPDDPDDVPGWVAELAARWECAGSAAGC